MVTKNTTKKVIKKAKPASPAKAATKIAVKTDTAKKEIKKEAVHENSGETSRAVGRRKRAAARVKLSRGKGNIIINGLDHKLYFPFFSLQETVILPLKTLAKDKDLDVSVKVSGGGKRGQAEAIQLGIARALVVWNPDFKKSLKTAGYLTRDARIKERKKFGLKKARRAPQWSKR